MRIRILCFIVALFSALAGFPRNTAARDELKNTDPEKYYILLDTVNQIVTVYEKDGVGEYTRIVRRFLCSTGRTELDPEDPEDVATPTPRGIWKIGGRERFGKFANFSGEYARYWTQIVESVYFHSIMFSHRNTDALQSYPYRHLGENVSHGCVRLYVEDAKWLYYYACPGTIVNVSTTEKPNPTLKRKLSSKLSFHEYDAMQKGIYDTEELPNLTAWTVLEDADLRSGNGSNDRRIAKLPIDTPVEVLQLGDPWCKVKYKKREGYLRTAYLTFEQGILESAPDADIVKYTTYLMAVPRDSKTRLFKVPTYTTAQVLSYGPEGYAEVEVWGTHGYLPTRALTKGWGLLP